MKLGLENNIDNANLIFSLFAKPPGQYRYNKAPKFLEIQNSAKNWSCDYTDNCTPDDPECFSTFSECLNYGYDLNRNMNGGLGSCCTYGWDKNTGYFEMCAGLMTKQTCGPDTTVDSVTTWYEQYDCDICFNEGSSSSSNACLEEAKEGYCSFCGAEDESGVWKQADSVYVSDYSCQDGYVIGYVTNKEAGFAGRDPNIIGLTNMRCLQKDKKGDLLSASYGGYSNGGCRGIFCNNTGTPSPIKRVEVKNSNCSYCESVVYISESCDAYIIDCGEVPADLDNSHCFPPDEGDGGPVTGKSSSSLSSKYCPFVECGCQWPDSCGNAECGMIPGYVLDCSVCDCVPDGSGSGVGSSSSSGYKTTSSVSSGDGGPGDGGTGDGGGTPNPSSQSSGDGGSTPNPSSQSSGDGGNVFTSSSSSFGLVEPLPYYTQTNIFSGTLADGTRVIADGADSGEMTNNNSYDSSTRVLQTFTYNESYDTTLTPVWVMATFSEVIEFTHVRIGPPPCFLDTNPNVSLRNAGALNGNYINAGAGCDGSFYTGATIEYSEDYATWTSLGNVTSTVFLDADRTSVRNEIVGSPTIKTAKYVRVVANGGGLGLSEFAVAFISTRWITILNPAPNFTSADNGATFSATVLATLNVIDEPIYYQWQISTYGNDWDDINAMPGISGENTNTLTITPDIPVGNLVSYNYDNKIFRCIVTATGAMKKISPEETFEMPPIIYGCTDPQANNYNASAQVDNGTCSY